MPEPTAPDGGYTVVYQPTPRHQVRVAGVTLSEIAARDWASALVAQERTRERRYRASVIDSSGRLVASYR